MSIWSSFSSAFSSIFKTSTATPKDNTGQPSWSAYKVSTSQQIPVFNAGKPYSDNNGITAPGGVQVSQQAVKTYWNLPTQSYGQVNYNSALKTFYVSTNPLYSANNLPTVQVDSKTGQVYMTPEVAAMNISGGNGPGVPKIDYSSFFDFTKKNYAQPGDPLGLNTWGISTGQGAQVKYQTVQSYDANIFQQNTSIIFENGKPAYRIMSDGSKVPFEPVTETVDKAYIL